jgi:hypothetical protein
MQNQIHFGQALSTHFAVEPFISHFNLTATIPEAEYMLLGNHDSSLPSICVSHNYTSAVLKF